MSEYILQLIKNRDTYPAHKRWKVVPKDNPNGKITPRGSTYAVAEDGNIEGLCVIKNGKERGSEVLKIAIRNGGTKLQAFGKKLFQFYTQNGFRPISWVKFDKEKAPEGWIPMYMEEPLIFYAFDKNMEIGTKQKFISFVFTTKPCKDAEEAYKIRDEWIKNNNRKEEK